MLNSGVTFLPRWGANHSSRLMRHVGKPLITFSRTSHVYSQLRVPESVKIVEVGARDGLQNEKKIVSAQVKANLINKLADSGLKSVEAGSFVNPQWVPQMSNTREVLQGINKLPGVSYPVLVPNMKGYDMARDCDVREVAVFSAASETFSKKNTNSSIAESLERIKPIFLAAKSDGVAVRGYVSCVLGCPYEGAVATSAVTRVAERLLEAGCYEVSLGDTIGVGTAGSTAHLVEALLKAGIKEGSLAVHFHDTYGQALANILVALQYGISVVDASLAGLGGCPYALGATGNVATEDVVYMLQGLGVQTGIDMGKLMEAGRYICDELGRTSASRVSIALKSEHREGDRKTL